jgi:hypothetical protein
VRLTDSEIVQERSTKFDGKVCWYGFSEKLDLTMRGGFFLHRRIVFRSPVAWPVGGVERRSDHIDADDAPSSYSRRPVTPISDKTTAGCLHRLFAEPTVRSALYGPLKTKGITTLEHRLYSYNGSADGAVRSGKTWNVFGAKKNGVVLKYKPQGVGFYTNALEDSTDYQHIYVADIFHYGPGGLDLKIPTAREIDNAVAAAKLSAATLNSEVQSGAPGKKKIKREEGVGEDVSMSESGSGDELVDVFREVEDYASEVAIVSTGKLYWNPPK